MAAQQRAVERKEQIIEATLKTLTERGVHATTHRNIAEAAGVPLGSLTYYFDGLSDLFVQAFELLYTRMAAAHRDALREATTAEEAVDAFTDMICGSRRPSDEMLRGLVELYSYASHEPKVQEICRRWTLTTHDSLRPHFPEHSIRALDALMEGWHFHQMAANEPAPRDLVHSAVRALAGK